ncbi:MAG: VCBS repeat-containing protein [Chitinophagaceae bacterium]
MMLRLSIVWVALPVFALLMLLLSWTKNAPPLFKLLPSSQTGINFTNTITETDKLNILNEAYIYNGGGVGLGDFNNDGLVDVYFAANMVSNKLYLNKGSLRFEDITDSAGVGGEGKWCTGVSTVDINADGWLDIYVSATFLKDPIQRMNLLYINQGLNKRGIPVFKESANAYGIADAGYSTQGLFFDYDKDGDLDLYVLTNTLNDKRTPIRYRPKLADGTALNTDRLYRNNGNETFTNVSREAGVLLEGWGHGVAVSDFNLDGWPDIYVSNDFIANDILYINNKNGTFTDRITEYFKHTSWYTMGTDVSDINNDGFADLVALDMLPEDNMRKKRMLSGNEYYNYFNNRQFDYQHQYVRNVLQLNSGITPAGHPVFSDIGFLSGIYQTDWSWTPLVADFDNDGFRDIIVTNGLPRDVTDLDYIVYNNGQAGGSVNSSLAMVDSLPIVKIPSYAFKNNGGILFSNTSADWGIHQPSFSNGAGYADLDNDGDLDLVINNINEASFVYENTLNNPANNAITNHLEVTFVGNGMNTRGIGASLRIYYDGSRQQFYEHQPCRGYLSSVDARAHFGIGAVKLIDSLRVQWPDGKIQLIRNIAVGKPITVSYQNASPGNNSLPLSAPSIYQPASRQFGLFYKHTQNDVVDYNIQPTLPHKFSQYGPAIAVGDIDKNGYDDLYIGGSPGIFFMQDAQGKFLNDSTRIASAAGNEAGDTGALLFDADNDKDLDLYVVTGNYDLAGNHPASQDRLYLNNGKGRFQKSSSALPPASANGSCIRAADFDGDGDLDLFVGGRVVSGAYPTPPRSYLLKNQGGKFVDVTSQYCPSLQQAGMITDALWSDFDNDKKPDLVLVGEWMPVSFFKNTGTAFVPVNKTSGISHHVGWWNSLVSGDFDNDGDIDYVAGNLGLNSNFKATSEEPMTLFAKDLDDNGQIDAMVFCFMKGEDGKRKPFPMHAREDMISQVISVRKSYPTFKAFGQASVDDLWNKQDRINALMMQANNLNTSYIENKGGGLFSIKSLPIEAQVAPVFGMVCEDVDGDGNNDLLLAGNDFGMEPGGGRHDAFMGLCLKGDGKGNFAKMTLSESGFFVPGDAKGLATIHSATGIDLLVATQNQDSLLVFSKAASGPDKLRWIDLNPDDFCAEVVYTDGRRKRMEFYYGSTFLSQSSRKLPLDNHVTRVAITNYRGVQREVDVN